MSSVHERLVTEKKILHRDISPNNIVFVPSELDGDRSVLLIDFDYAAHLDGRPSPYPKGTVSNVKASPRAANASRQGTLPFVSMEILRQVSLHYAAQDDAKITHEVADDLESFFYVFAWICVLYDGPNNSLATPLAEDNTSIIHGWAEAALEKGGLTNALNAKNSFVHALQANQTINNQFTPYFQNMKPLAREWRTLVKEEDDRRVRAHWQDPDEPSHENHSQPLTHRMVIDVLRSHLKTLSH